MRRSSLRADLYAGATSGRLFLQLPSRRQPAQAPSAPRFDGRILFLEDTGEKAYRIDRMLVQLRQSGALGRVAGIVFGAIRPLGGEDLERTRIAEFAAEQTRDLDCPVLFGIEAGHGSENLALPFGAAVRLEAGARRMVCEDAVVS